MRNLVSDFPWGERHDAIGPDKRRIQFYAWRDPRIRANRLREFLHKLLREKRARRGIRQRQLPDRLQSRVLLVSLRTPWPVAKTGRSQTSQAGGVLQITGADFGGETRRLAFPDDAGMLEHIDAVGVRQREGDVLLAKQHRDRGGLAQALQRLGQLLEDDRRQAERRLVEDEQFRLHHQRTRNGQYLLLAAGQRSGGLLLAVAQDREQVEQPGDLLRALRRRQMLAAEVEIFAYRHIDEQLAAFGALHDALARDGRRGEPAQRSALAADVARIGQKAGDGVEQRGLFVKGHSDHRDEFAGMDVDRDVVERLRLAVMHADILDLEEWR